MQPMTTSPRAIWGSAVRPDAAWPPWVCFIVLVLLGVAWLALALVGLLLRCAAAAGRWGRVECMPRSLPLARHGRTLNPSLSSKAQPS